jgi:hypothetical protein
MREPLQAFLSFMSRTKSGEASAKETVHLPVRVVHTTPDKKGRWIIGCEFIFQLTENERKTLLVDNPSHTPAEKSPGPAR